MIRIFLFVAFVLILAQSVSVISGCATIIPPEGGPRDSLSPVLLEASPRDSTRGFTNNRIVLTFNEYIGDVNTYYQEMIVSPLPKNMPLVTRKLETVTIKLRDTLEENTTYTIDFGNTIKDVNEGNIYKNFRYTFTTGSYFDSLSLAGKVIFAETGTTDSTLTVMLHTSGLDSAVVNDRPRYIARTDKQGRFRFRNLPPGNFYIYALQDQGNSYRYLSRTQQFAFSDEAINTSTASDSIILFAYAAEKEKPMANAASNTSNNRRNNNNNNVQDNRLIMSADLPNNMQDILKPLTLQFAQPLQTFDSSKVYFSTDSIYQPVSDFHWELDTTMKKAVLHTNWQENTLYHLIFEKDFATDQKGFQLLKTDTLHFTTKKNADYGRVTIRFTGLDVYENPVLQLLQNNEIVHSFPLDIEIFSRTLFLPGEYTMRILEDDNQNTIWDPGDFFNGRKQPEKVYIIDRKISIKPNWDNDFEIAAPDKL